MAHALGIGVISFDQTRLEKYMGTFWAHSPLGYEIDENEGWHGVSVKTGVRGLSGKVMSVLKQTFCSQSKMHMFISISLGSVIRISGELNCFHTACEVSVSMYFDQREQATRELCLSERIKISVQLLSISHIVRQ